MERVTFVEQQVPFVLTNTSNYTFNLLKMSGLEIVVKCSKCQVSKLLSSAQNVMSRNSCQVLKMSSLEIFVTFFSWKLRYYHFQTIFFNKYCKILPTKIQKFQSYTKQVKLRGHVAQ